MLSKRKIRGWRAASAEGFQRKGLHRRSARLAPAVSARRTLPPCQNYAPGRKHQLRKLPIGNDMTKHGQTPSCQMGNAREHTNQKTGRTRVLEGAGEGASSAIRHSLARIQSLRGSLFGNLRLPALRTRSLGGRLCALIVRKRLHRLLVRWAAAGRE